MSFRGLFPHTFVRSWSM